MDKSHYLREKKIVKEINIIQRAEQSVKKETL